VRQAQGLAGSDVVAMAREFGLVTVKVRRKRWDGKLSKQNRVKGSRCELTRLSERANHCFTAPGSLISSCTDERMDFKISRFPILEY
jgi:hypothetical protein